MATPREWHVVGDRLLAAARYACAPGCLGAERRSAAQGRTHCRLRRLWPLAPAIADGHNQWRIFTSHVWRVTRLDFVQLLGLERGGLHRGRGARPRAQFAASLA